MPLIRAPAMIAAMLLASNAVFGAERTVVLAVDNMTCASCPYIVKQSLARVSGVRAVEVSFERHTAVVTFEASQASIADLTASTAAHGFPSRPIEQ